MLKKKNQTISDAFQFILVYQKYNLNMSLGFMVNKCTIKEITLSFADLTIYQSNDWLKKSLWSSLWKLMGGECMEPETQSHKYQHHSHLLRVRESYLGRLSDPCRGMRRGLENMKETRQLCIIKSEGVNEILSFCCSPPTLTVPIRLL